MLANDMTAQCSQIDVAEAEKVAQNIQESVQGLIVNVDMTSVQYDMDKMIQVATELGFDDEEVNGLGFDLKENKCNAGVCKLDASNLKLFDKLSTSSPVLKRLADKAKCHPLIKDQVTPKVQYIWAVWPFNYLCLECIPWFELCFVHCTPLAPICWLLYYPFVFFFAIPFNLFMECLLLPITLLFFPCIWLGWFTYYLVLPP